MNRIEGTIADSRTRVDDLKPTLICIPGSCHGPSHYEDLSNCLASLGYPTKLLSLPSNHDSSSSYLETTQDDVTWVADIIEKEANNGNEVIVLMHSYGGVVGNAACKGLLKADRKQEGKKGGIVALAYMAAFVLNEGQDLASILNEDNPNVFKNPDGSIIVGGPLESDEIRELLYHDVPRATANKALRELNPQSGRVLAQFISPGAPWKQIPALYIVTEKDRALPAELQQMMASQPDGLWTIDSLDTGHSPFLVCPEKVAQSLDSFIVATVNNG